jgi:hypothetical protein
MNSKDIFNELNLDIGYAAEIPTKCKIAIESLFAGVKSSVKAYESWKYYSTFDTECEPEFGKSTHVCFCVGVLKEESIEIAPIVSLKKQLNRSIREVAKMFPNSENETLLWRIEPAVIFSEWKDEQKIFIRFRLSSMPFGAFIIEEDVTETNENANMPVKATSNETPIATKVA